LKRAGTDESTLSEEEVIEYLQIHTEPVGLNEVIDRWRENLIHFGFDQLTDEPSDPNDEIFSHTIKRYRFLDKGTNRRLFPDYATSIDHVTALPIRFVLPLRHLNS
jgi:hypothetical protein